MDFLFKLLASFLASFISLIMLFPPVKEIKRKKSFKWKRWKSIYLIIYFFFFLFFSFMVFLEGIVKNNLVLVLGSFIVFVIALFSSYEDVNRQKNKDTSLFLITPALLLSIYIFFSNPLLSILYLLASLLVAKYPKIKFLDPYIFEITYWMYNLNIVFYALFLISIFLFYLYKMFLSMSLLAVSFLAFIFPLIYFKKNIFRIFSTYTQPKMNELIFPPSIYSYFFLSNNQPSIVIGDLIYLKSKKIIDVAVSFKGNEKKLRINPIKPIKDKILSYLIDKVKEKQADDGYVDAVEFSLLSDSYMSELKYHTKKLEKDYLEYDKIKLMEKSIFIIFIVFLSSFFILKYYPSFFKVSLSILISMFVSYVIIMTTSLKFNEKGYKEYLKINSYLDWLKTNTRIKELPFTAVELWDEHFAYALSFGVAKRAIKELSLTLILAANENVERAYSYFKREIG